MNYTINSTKRKLIICCSLFLFLFKVTMGLYYFFNVPTYTAPLWIGFNNLLYIIPYGYIMLVFIDYFKQTQLKGLQIITLILLSVEIVTGVFNFINLYNPLIPKIVLVVINAIWCTALIVWTILLFMAKIKDTPALLSIRYFASGLLLYLVLWMIPMIPGLVKPENIYAALPFVSMTLAIPFIFSLNFAMKFKEVKEAG